MPTLQRRRLLFGGRPFSPAQLPGLALWLRADAGVMKGTSARQYTKTSSQAHTSDDFAGHEIGNADKTIGIWVRRDSTADLQTCVGKALGTGNQREYRCTYRTSGSQWQWICFSDGGNVNFATAAIASSGTGVWELLLLEHDAANDVIRISVNAGTPVATAFATGVFTGTAGFAIGADAKTAANFMNGRIGSCGKWSRILSAADKTEFYNGGRALSWADLSVGLQTGAEFYYNNDEQSGNAADSSGAGLTLTASASAPTVAVGSNFSPAANTDPVMIWRDVFSPLSRRIEQGLTANRPLLNTAAQNGLPVINCDGVDDYLTGLLGATIAQPWTILAACQSASGTAALLDGGTPAEFLLRRNGANWDFYAGANIAGPAHDTNFHQFTMVGNGASGRFRVDRVEFTGNVGADSLTGLTTGARSDGTNVTATKAGEIIACSGALSDRNLALAEAYLKQRWGTP